MAIADWATSLLQAAINTEAALKVMAGFEMADSTTTWTVFYLEGRIITFDRGIPLPTELEFTPDSQVLYAVSESTPPVYRVPRDGSWILLGESEVKSAMAKLLTTRNHDHGTSNSSELHSSMEQP